MEKKQLSKIQKINLRSLKQKEESISTLLTTIKSNQKFAKLLIFTLNSLQSFVSPPNKEIRTNSRIIIKQNGVEILHLISEINISKDEIISLSGDILYKLIFINDVFDKELSKFFAEKNGHKAIIDILLKKKKDKENKALLPYIKILNGLAQIPQLIQTLIENNIIDTINIDLNNIDINDINSIRINLNTLKLISTQKIGRDYLIKQKLSEKIIKLICKRADLKDLESVLSGLGIIENLCRNEEGKKELKNNETIDSLSYIYNILGYDQSIIKISARIYCKIASAEDLKMQLDLLKKYYEESIENNFININKSLELISNFILVDELGLILKEEDYFELLLNLFIKIQEINIEDKDKEFINTYISINKNFMNIFFRLCVLIPNLVESNSELMKYILNSIFKIWEVTKNLEDNIVFMIFNSYFVSYGEIFNIYAKNNLSNLELKNILIYINKNILINGEKNLNIDPQNINPHKIACILMKISNSILVQKELNEENNDNNDDELLQSLVACYSYLEFLFIKMEDEEILCYALDLIFDLVKSQKDFKENKLNLIIFKICEFMNNKNKQRYPCLLCMKLLDIFLTDEYIYEYLNEKDSNKNQTHNIDYIDCIVNVITFNEIDILENKNNNIEEEIKDLGNKLLEKLCNENYFINLLKEFCDNTKNFDPSKNNKEIVNTLEKNIKRITGIIELNNYFEKGANEVLNSLKNLIEKELKFIEFFKRDKTNEKNPDFNNIIQNSSSRLFLELNLNFKLSTISIKKINFEVFVLNLDIIFLFLGKSSDKKNIKYILNDLKSNYSFILNNITNIKLPNEENIIEKLININIALLRKMIEEDDLIFSVINNLIFLAEKNIIFCNNMVKAGCPRLLLQIIETSPIEKNVEIAVNLLKIICNSNKENLQMISSQNVFNAFFNVKKKYASNSTIINSCDDISKDILKLPGQENYVIDLLSENIREFNINSQKDFSNDEIRQQLLNSLQIINSFVSSQTQIDLINNNEEFIMNFKEITEKTFSLTELDSLIEKLIINELSLLKKLSRENHNFFGYDYIIEKAINIIKNKSKYQDILITGIVEFLKILSIQTLYEKYISKKIDNSFIDCIFDAIDNNIGNIKETKDLNNILFYLCLYNEDFASYIKQKGGLSNVYEELKNNIDNQDKTSIYLKLNSLKMIFSLCNDKNEVEAFIKSNGYDLINKIIENENEFFKKYENDFEKNMYKVREIEDINENNNDDLNHIHIVIYAFKLLLKIIDFDEKFFNNKIINDMVLLSEAIYPNKELFLELSSLLSKDNKYISLGDKYLFLLLKNILSLKLKYDEDKDFINNTIEKILDILLPKIFESNNYYTNLKSSLDENTNNNLQLIYLSEIIFYYEKIKPNIEIPIFQDIKKFTIDYIEYYKENNKEEISSNIILYLLDILSFLAKNKNENKLNLVENMNIIGDISHNILFKSGNEEFTYDFLVKCNNIFDNIEQNKEKDNILLKYLDNIISKSINFISNLHQILSSKNKYNSVDKQIVSIFDLILNYMKYFYIDGTTSLDSNKIDNMLNTLNYLIKDFINIEDIDEDKRKEILDDLFIIILGVLSKMKILNIDFNLYQNEMMNLLENIKISKDKFDYFAEIINLILNKLDLSQELYDKSIDNILNNLKNSPPIELELNLDSLAILSKDLNIIKNLIDNPEFMFVITSLYKDKQNLQLNQQRNISLIYNNLFKNAYNTESILNKNPEIIETLVNELSKKENTINNDENIDIPQKELNTIVSILKDKNNKNQLIEKNLITKENIDNIIDNYKDKNNALNDTLNELKNIMEPHENNNIIEITNNNGIKEEVEKAKEEEHFEENKKEEEKVEVNMKEEEIKDKEDLKEKDINNVVTKENFESEKSLLNNLKEKINKAFEEHLKILNIPINEEVSDNNNEINDIIDLTTINNNKRKLSIISYHLNYNKEQNIKIESPINTKTNEEISSSLDNLMSLIRLLYLKYKTNTEKDIHEERIYLIKESLNLLKKFTICNINHKIILEIGLLSFIEKLNKEEEFIIYLEVLDVIKNCTYSEDACQFLLLSNFYDVLIEDIFMLYNDLEILKNNKDKQRWFYYDNIILNNVAKYNQGYQHLYNKIGIEKMLIIGNNTVNAEFWESCIDILINNYENLNEKKEINSPQLINNIISIIKKIFCIKKEEIKGILIIKTLKLIGYIYDENNKNIFSQLGIIKILDSSFDIYKNEKGYIENIINLLKLTSFDNNDDYNEFIESNLINKIMNQIISGSFSDELIKKFSDILYNILTMDMNEKNICLDDIINHVFDYIDKYSKKLLDINNNNKNEKNEEIQNIKENESITSEDNLVKIYNLILNNYLRISQYLSKNKKKDIINEKYLNLILNTINKPKIDLSNINICLISINDCYIKIEKEKWSNESIQNVYLILTSLKESYYSNSEILININILVGNILKGLSLKFLIERYYSLALEGINCQDWNEKLVKLTLVILKDCLIKYKELQNEVFENTGQVLLNTLKLYPNNYLIQFNGYYILSLFSDIAFAHILINTDLISLIRNSLLNKELISNEEQKTELKMIIYSLLKFLVIDKNENTKISLELMDCLINDLNEDSFFDYFNDIINILLILFKDKLSIETFVQNSGLEIIAKCLDKFYQNKIFIFNVFKLLREIIFSSNENKEKIKQNKIAENISNLINKIDNKNKKIIMEGKILIYNINFINKEKTEENNDNIKKPTYLEYIEKEKIIKNEIYNVITKGILVKSPNPKGKIKEFNLAFAPDLMKIYLKKPKSSNIPPKSKYTIETPLIKDVIPQYLIPNFKKGKPPDKQLCFAIEQELIEGQKEPKILVIICSNHSEENKLWGYVEIIVDYIKRECGKEYKFKIDNYKKFFDDIKIERKLTERKALTFRGSLK